jgi:hypothetical protein
MNDNLNDDVDDGVDEEKAYENKADLIGFLLKIAVGGITVQDFVKRLEEDDILVAIDGQPYLDGPQRLRETFLKGEDQEAKWLLTFYRGGVLFDILIDHPIKSSFGYATESETKFVLAEFTKHAFGEFQGYENFEVYRDKSGKCDILSFRPDPLAWIVPPLWLLKHHLYPPLSVVLIVYLLTYTINIYFFLGTAITLAIYINRAQNNLMRSFTMFADKYHYMTVAACNEADVSLVVRRIDPNNRVRFEKNIVKKRVEIKKTIEKTIDDSDQIGGS